MKAHLRIPTKQQYAYIEIEVECKTTKEAVDLYEEATNYYKNLPEKQEPPFESKPLMWPNQEQYDNGYKPEIKSKKK